MNKLVYAVVCTCIGAMVISGAALAKGKSEQASADVPGATKTHYKCELGKKITVFTKPEEGDRITLHWNNKNHTLTREATTTGAHRFEDKKAGLVWINIPAKSILLDAKAGRQLANDCKV